MNALRIDTTLHPALGVPDHDIDGGTTASLREAVNAAEYAARARRESITIIVGIDTSQSAGRLVFGVLPSRKYAEARERGLGTRCAAVGTVYTTGQVNIYSALIRDKSAYDDTR